MPHARKSASLGSILMCMLRPNHDQKTPTHLQKKHVWTDFCIQKNTTHTVTKYCSKNLAFTKSHSILNF